MPESYCRLTDFYLFPVRFRKKSTNFAEKSDAMRNWIILCFFLFLLPVPDRLTAQSNTTQSQEMTQRISLSVNDNKVTVINAPCNSVLKIYSLVGVKVVERKVTLPRQEFTFDLPVGYYIAKIADQTHKITIR
jgi:hypothetical protein